MVRNVDMLLQCESEICPLHMKTISFDINAKRCGAHIKEKIKIPNMVIKGILEDARTPTACPLHDHYVSGRFRVDGITKVIVERAQKRIAEVVNEVVFECPPGLIHNTLFRSRGVTKAFKDE